MLDLDILKPDQGVVFLLNVRSNVVIYFLVWVQDLAKIRVIDSTSMACHYAVGMCSVRLCQSCAVVF